MTALWLLTTAAAFAFLPWQLAIVVSLLTLVAALVHTNHAIRVRCAAEVRRRVAAEAIVTRQAREIRDQYAAPLTTVLPFDRGAK